MLRRSLYVGTMTLNFGMPAGPLCPGFRLYEWGGESAGALPGCAAPCVLLTMRERRCVVSAGQVPSFCPATFGLF